MKVFGEITETAGVDVDRVGCIGVRHVNFTNVNVGFCTVKLRFTILYYL